MCKSTTKHDLCYAVDEFSLIFKPLFVAVSFCVLLTFQLHLTYNKPVFHLFVLTVCDEHKEFKDMKLFYRFRKDDGTFPLDSEARVLMRGQRIYEK